MVTYTASAVKHRELWVVVTYAASAVKYRELWVVAAHAAASVKYRGVGRLLKSKPLLHQHYKSPSLPTWNLPLYSTCLIGINKLSVVMSQ